MITKSEILTCNSCSECPSLEVESLTPLSVEGDGDIVAIILLLLPTDVLRGACRDGCDLVRTWHLVGPQMSLKTGEIQLAQQGSPSLEYTLVKILNF